MDTLHDVNVDDKVYRAWYMLSRNTRISVKTGTGMTAEADLVIGKGTVGGARMETWLLSSERFY